MIELNNKIFCLVNALNYNGTPKNGELYDERIGCITKGIKQVYIDNNGHYTMLMTFILDAQNQVINRRLQTSIVDDIVATEDGFKLYTQNTIYVFREVQITQFAPLIEEQNLIELYLNNEFHQFCFGYYYDKDKKPHELHERLHLGMFQDSVQIRMNENNITVCRYFPNGASIEFYDTIYHEQRYQTPILIHNVGKKSLKVILGENAWNILPGDEQKIIPKLRK